MPIPIPVAALVAMVGLVKVPVPETTDHAPVPITGAVALILGMEGTQVVAFTPAMAGEGLSLMIVTFEVAEPHAVVVTVQR